MLVMRRCLLDVVVLTGLYIAISPDTSRADLTRFVLLFFGLNFVLRALELDYSDALNRGVAIALAGRLIR